MNDAFRRPGLPPQQDVPASVAQKPSDERWPGVRHILVALDGSTAAEAILERVRPLALDLGAHVTLIRAISPFETAHQRQWSPDASDENGSVIRSVEIYLQRLVEMLRLSGVDASFECVGGTRPADIILARASELEVDLIALTGHGHGAGSGMPVGSTAHGIVRAALCPVLLVGAAATGHQPDGSSKVTRGIGAATDGKASLAGVR